MEKRRDWKRPVIVLAALGALTVAALAAPASAHLGSFGHLKKHIKKIAKKVAKQQISSTSTTNLFIEESELERFGPINLNVGQNQTIGTFGAGSFTFRAVCNDLGAGVPEGIIELTTSRDNSAMDSDDDEFDDFDTGDTASWAFEDSADATTQEISSEEDGFAHAWSPNGLSIEGLGAQIVLNPQNVSADCSFAGGLLIVSPGTA
jgi:hypothetical protein